MAAYAHTNSKGQTYFLHSKEVILRGGRKQMIYFFAREEKETGGLDQVPEGLQVVENQKTGLPMLKRKDKE